ncbi:hypothetical protein D9613_011299 [Agrocybe pediades]|uniref:Uncharacterized protein n=1 Tax=Agrocybe pediades TaxID=84607 RepID=A0A8H4QSI1_9AGAR|nr:hypothetical protein D9613_011299 [Agrocybe pediades]
MSNDTGVPAMFFFKTPLRFTLALPPDPIGCSVKKPPTQLSRAPSILYVSETSGGFSLEFIVGRQMADAVGLLGGGVVPVFVYEFTGTFKHIQCTTAIPWTHQTSPTLDALNPGESGPIITATVGACLMLLILRK